MPTKIGQYARLKKLTNLRIVGEIITLKLRNFKKLRNYKF